MPRSGHNAREYWAVYGCVRMLTAAVVAVTVAVKDIAQDLRSQYFRGCASLGYEYHDACLPGLRRSGASR
jgi:hypothetical protein